MKQVIKAVLVLIVLTNFGCNTKETPSEKGVLKIENEEKLIEDFKKEIANRKTVCQDIVVIDLDSIEPANLQQWKDDHTNFECTEQLNSNTVDCIIDNECSENLFFIDLQLIKDEVNPSDENHNKKRAEWLQKNGKYICFRGTTPYIQSRHDITSLFIRALMDLSKSYKLTFKEFKDEVNKAGGAGYYNSDAYDNYLVISISGGNVLITLSKTFETKFVCYSVPFFRSIEQKECLKDDDEIYFVPITIDGKETIGFKIKSQNGPSYYFDYSNEPKFSNNFY